MLGILLAVLWAGFFVFSELTTNPRPWYDEGGDTQLARNLALHGKIGLKFFRDDIPNHPWAVSIAYPLVVPVAVAFKLFGVSIGAGRSVMAIFLFGFLAAAFFFIRGRAGMWRALLSLALLITFAPLYGNGKPVLGEVPGIFYLFLGMTLLADAIRAPLKQNFFWAGIISGLAAVTKPTFFLMYPAFAIGWLHRLLQKKSRLREDGMFALGLLVSFIPWAATTIPWGNGPEFWQMVGYFANQYGETNVPGRMLANLGGFLSESTLMHAGALLVVAVVSIIAVKRFRTTPLLILVSFAVINAVWYLKSPGWFRYIFPGHLVLLALLPVWISEMRKKWQAVAVATIILLVAIQGVHLIKNYRAFAFTSTREMAAMLRSLPPGEVYVPDELELVTIMPHENYSQIFVQPNLFVLGKDRLLAGEGKLPNFVVGGRASYPYFEKRKDILDTHYALRYTIGIYRLYECVNGCL